MNVEAIKNVIALDSEISENTKVGLIKGIFSNDDEIKNELKAMDMGEFFNSLKNEVSTYYQE